MEWVHPTPETEAPWTRPELKDLVQEVFILAVPHRQVVRQHFTAAAAAAPPPAEREVQACGVAVVGGESQEVPEARLFLEVQEEQGPVAPSRLDHQVTFRVAEEGVGLGLQEAEQAPPDTSE